MSKLTSVAVGKQEELNACSYLESMGLVLLENNYRTHFGEIDLIMQDEDYLVFIEVRFRQEKTHGDGIETISKTKQQKIIKTALYYLQQKRLLNKTFCRFDVVGIQPGKKFLWIKDAFGVQY